MLGHQGMPYSDWENVPLLTVPSTPSSPADSHKNEGFLKSAWHRLTHQHDNTSTKPASPASDAEAKGEDEEPKKAAGSG